MTKLRVGVIGVGWFGTVHCRAVADHPQLELAALCDRSEERLAEMAREHGVARTCTDYQELIDDPTIDVLDIVTPWDHHAEPAIAGLAAGKHVFVEKPMASTLAECQRICDAARDAESILMVGHVCRFNPRFAAAKREIDAGRIGKVVAITARRNCPAMWTKELLQEIGPILHTGVHDTDLMLWFTGAKAVSAYAQTVNVQSLPHADVAHVMYRFDTGASATYESAWCIPDAAPFDIDERMSIIGTEGFVHVQDTFPNIGICSKDGFKSPDTTYWPELHGLTGGTLRDEWSYFARCALEGRRPDIITPEESMEAVRTVLAAEESASTGKVVVLD
jgi:UDP-N-acetylglucosamine 3-dehydrogenase